jgi:hypothetical protein
VISKYGEKVFVANLDDDGRCPDNEKKKFYKKKDDVMIRHFWRVPSAKEVMNLQTNQEEIRQEEWV